MKLIAGLGNPGKRYERTRHNVGFECLEALARRLGANSPQAKFDSSFFDVRVGEERILLVQPLTFMNLSGRSVHKFVDFFRIPLPEILVICDDLALPPGTVRMRASGSSGGQKGLQNICDLLGSQDIPRLRIGIGNTPPNWDTADYVLAKISAEDRVLLDSGIERAVQAAECWVRDGISKAMNVYNVSPLGS